MSGAIVLVHSQITQIILPDRYDVFVKVKFRICVRDTQGGMIQVQSSLVGTSAPCEPFAPGNLTPLI